jgi:murein DD-endopeptidase MepM/ murein hydrolase activator NlpD
MIKKIASRTRSVGNHTQLLFKPIMYMAMIVLIAFVHPVSAQTGTKIDTGPLHVILSPVRIEQGCVARITVTCPATVESVSYTIHDTKSVLSMDKPGMYSGFVPVAMEQKPGLTSIAITLHNTDKTTNMLNTSLEIIDKDFSVQHLTIDESKNTLSKTDLDRHNRERAMIKKMFSQSQPQKLWGQSFAKPLQGRLSTPFGVKRFINKQPRNPHSGVDIAAPSGTPVKATAAGVVSLTGTHFFAGKSVYIDHGHDIISMYFHLDSISVQDGQTIAKGDILGRVGATGRATGPHLHWGMRIQDTPIDPFSLLTLFEK